MNPPVPDQFTPEPSRVSFPRILYSSICGGVTAGILAAVVYGMAGHSTGQTAEGAVFGGVLGLTVGGSVGGILGAVTRRTVKRVVTWALAGAALAGVAFAALNGLDNFRSCPWPSTAAEVLRNEFYGLTLTAVLGGTLGAFFGLAAAPLGSPGGPRQAAVPGGPEGARVHVALLDEGTEVYRPVEAAWRGGDAFEIVSPARRRSTGSSARATSSAAARIRSAEASSGCSPTSGRALAGSRSRCCPLGSGDTEIEHRLPTGVSAQQTKPDPETPTFRRAEKLPEGHAGRLPDREGGS